MCDVSARRKTDTFEPELKAHFSSTAPYAKCVPLLSCDGAHLRPPSFPRKHPHLIFILLCLTIQVHPSSGCGVIGASSSRTSSVIKLLSSPIPVLEGPIGVCAGTDGRGGPSHFCQVHDRAQPGVSAFRNNLPYFLSEIYSILSLHNRQESSWALWRSFVCISFLPALRLWMAAEPPCFHHRHTTCSTSVRPQRATCTFKLTTAKSSALPACGGAR